MERIKERLILAAESGLFFNYLRMKPEEAKELAAQGLDIRVTEEKKFSAKMYRVSWEWNSVEGNVLKLDENNQKYSLAEKLWIISTKMTI